MGNKARKIYVDVITYAYANAEGLVITVGKIGL